MKIHGLSILLMILLFSSTGLLGKDFDQTMELTSESVNQNIITPDDMTIEITKREYPIADPGEFFWAGDYFVEFLGEGIGTWITAPNGTVTELASDDVYQYNDETIILEHYWYDSNPGPYEIISYSLYHIPTQTMTDLNSNYGWFESVVPGEGILFSNETANIATLYYMNGTTNAYNYSSFLNSTHSASVHSLVQGHLIIIQSNRDLPLESVYLVNIDTNKNTTVLLNADEAGIGFDPQDPDWLYISESEWGSYSRVTRYNILNQSSTTHSFPGINNNNDFPDLWDIQVSNGWIVGSSSYQGVFFTHHWSTNTSSYLTHNPDSVIPDVTFKSGLNRNMTNNDHFYEVYILNETHGIMFYENSDLQLNTIVIFGLAPASLSSEFSQFTGFWGWMYKIPTSDNFYIKSTLDPFSESNPERYTLHTAFMNITHHENALSKIAANGIPMIEWTRPENVFDFPELGRTVFIESGEENDTIVVYEEYNKLASINLPIYVGAAQANGSMLYLGGDQLISFDVSLSTGYNVIYDFTSSAMWYNSQLYLYDDSLVFLVYNYTIGKIHFGELSLSDYSYSWRDDQFSTNIRSISFYQDWAAIFNRDTNLTIMNFRTGENYTHDITDLYQSYANFSWYIDTNRVNSVILPGFNGTNGEILLMMSTRLSSNDYSYYRSELVLLDVGEGKISNPTKYGFKDSDYGLQAGITSSHNSTNIVFVTPTLAGSDISLLTFNEDLTWQILNFETSDNLGAFHGRLHLIPNGLIAYSPHSGILIYTFSEAPQITPPLILSISYPSTASVFENIYVEIRTLDGLSGVEYVNISYHFDGFGNNTVTMNSIRSDFWGYTVPSINDGNSTYFEFQITIVDTVGNIETTGMYKVVLTYTAPTPSSPTSPTATSTPSATTSASDDASTSLTSSESTSTESPGFLFIIALTTLFLFPVIMRKKR